MIYAVLVMILLVVMLGYLYSKLKIAQKQIKELMLENDVHNIKNKSQNKDIYFKIDKDFKLTYIREQSLQNIVGKPVLGTILEDSEAVLGTLKSAYVKICKKPETINTQQIIINTKGERKLMLCRIRPLLNSVLECEGMSFMCVEEELNGLQEKLTSVTNRDPLTKTLKEEALLAKLEHEFLLNKRYNREFSMLAVELKDLYDFINQGIDFETGDKLLKKVTELCVKNCDEKYIIGRFDKTKIGIIMSGENRTKALALSQKILDDAIIQARKLGVDEYNAQMIVISYTNRKNVNDNADTLLGRLRRHTKAALRKHLYGIISSEERGKTIQ